MEELLHLYKKIYSVLLPSEFVQNKYVGELKGILIENTGIFNVLLLHFNMTTSV